MSEARVIPFRDVSERVRNAAQVAEHLRSGGLIMYPTETVYGFGCTLIPAALATLARVKAREAVKPFLLLIRSAEELPGVRWTDAARRLAEAFWPGPLTLALPAVEGAFPAGVLSPDGTVAARVSPHPAATALLDAVRRPITSTSVNAPGEAPAASFSDACAVVAQLEPALRERLLLLDGGTLPPSAPSTIVDCSREPPRVVRAGAIPLEALRGAVLEIDG